MRSSVNYQKLFVFLFLYLSCAVFLLPYFTEVFPIKQTCVFSLLTGHPSPTCGATRALVSLLHLNPIMALNFNPLATILWLTGTVLALSILTAGKPNLGFLLSSMRGKRFLVWGFAVLVAANWLYLLINERFLHENPLANIPLLF